MGCVCGGGGGGAPAFNIFPQNMFTIQFHQTEQIIVLKH